MDSSFLDGTPKKGAKAFLLCDSITGYRLKHKFYHEKGAEEYKPKNLCNELLTGYEKLGYHVYMDNYYTSILLLEELSEKGISCTGTIRKIERECQM